MKVSLSLGKDGRLLAQARLDQNNAIGSINKYIAPGEEFLGVSFDQLAGAAPGVFEIPEQTDSTQVAPDMENLPPDQQEVPQ